VNASAGSSSFVAKTSGHAVSPSSVRQAANMQGIAVLLDLVIFDFLLPTMIKLN
jgi:hypothetical protein